MKPAMYRRSSEQKAQVGFTLVEIVVGIVISAIALTFLSALFFSNAGRSVEPLLQIRAAEFGQALMDEILAKNFDEATPVGGYPACNPVDNPCSTIAGDNTDADGEVRADFDDVDDYNVYCPSSVPVEDSSGNPPANFDNFLMRVCVDYDSDYNGTLGDGFLAKLITIEIYPPTGAGLGSPIVFSAYKGNF